MLASRLLTAFLALGLVGSAAPGQESLPFREIPGGKPITKFAWVGSTDFLVFRDNPSTEAIRKNRETGAETPLAGLSGHLKASLAKPDDTNIITGVSPDGVWLLWWPLGNPRFFAAKLDGSQVVSWERPSTFVSPRWKLSGHQWFLTRDSTVLFAQAEGAVPEIVLYDPENPKKTTTIPTRTQPLKPGQKALEVHSEFNRIEGLWPKARTAAGYTYSFLEDAALRRDRIVGCPNELSALGIANIPRVVPGGAQLIWKIDLAEDKGAHFGMSDLEGKGARRLGSILAPEGGTIKFGLFDPHLSPDDKSLAVLANGKIQTLDLPGK